MSPLAYGGEPTLQTRDTRAFIAIQPQSFDTVKIEIHSSLDRVNMGDGSNQSDSTWSTSRNLVFLNERSALYYYFKLPKEGEVTDSHSLSSGACRRPCAFLLRHEQHEDVIKCQEEGQSLML